MKDLLHVAVGGSCGFLRTAAVLTRTQIGCIPVPPMVLSVRLLVRAVMLRRLVEQFSKRCNLGGSCPR